MTTFTRQSVSIPPRGPFSSTKRTTTRVMRSANSPSFAPSRFCARASLFVDADARGTNREFGGSAIECSPSAEGRLASREVRLARLLNAARAACELVDIESVPSGDPSPSETASCATPSSRSVSAARSTCTWVGSRSSTSRAPSSSSPRTQSPLRTSLSTTSRRDAGSAWPACGTIIRPHSAALPTARSPSRSP